MPVDTKTALDGIIVCDFSWVGAGPIATNILAQCGARVIKIESLKRPDILRKGGPFKDGISRGMDRSGYFANRNSNKEGISLNMGNPKARDVAVKLIEKSDIIINNFRVGQMEKWDLGWEAVKQINPRIVYVTMSLQGVTGPHRSYMGYGVNLNALCGLTARAAFPGEKPFGTGTNYTDHVMVPTNTLFGIMAALLEREVTGVGQTVAISQLEAAICMKPMDPMAYASSGDVLGPIGYGDQDAVPHGVYKTLGYRKWIAIAVFSKKEWNALQLVMGNPAWIQSDQFSTPELRRENERELNDGIEEWTSWQYADVLMDNLLQHGVKAGIVKDAREVIDDRHLRERKFWVYLDHPEVGVSLYNRAPIVFSGTPITMNTPAPSIGQHTKNVLTGMLGYSANDVDQLIKEDVLT